MKSLEIVNKKINYCEEQEVPCVSIRLVSLQQIKQDLEVLEIISKKNVRIGEIKYYLKELKGGIAISITKIEDVLIVYNKGVALEDELTMEELLKLKQWLKENENV